MNEKINDMLKERSRLGDEIIVYMRENDFIKDLDLKTMELVNRMSELLAYDDEILEVMAEQINVLCL